jgi:hypothetical protein
MFLGISGLYYKNFTIVIYDCNESTIVIYDRNDNDLYNKTTIKANLALARSVNYDRKVFSKLKRNLQS